MNGPLIDHAIDQSIVLRFRRGHKEIAVSVGLNLVERLTGSVSKFLVQTILQEQDFVGLDTNIAGLTPCTAKRLVDHDARMLKTAAFPFGPCTKEKSTHAGSKADTNRLYIRLNVLHGVEDPETVIDRPPR